METIDKYGEAQTDDLKYFLNKWGLTHLEAFFINECVYISDLVYTLHDRLEVILFVSGLQWPIIVGEKLRLVAKICECRQSDIEAKKEEEASFFSFSFLRWFTHTHTHHHSSSS